jgi:hypothetical protein
VVILRALEQASIVACLVPPQHTYRLQDYIQNGVQNGPPSLVFTSKNVAEQLSNLDSLRTPTSKIILFVDPALRFLPPIEGLRHYVLPQRRQRQWDRHTTQVVEKDYFCDKEDAFLTSGLGQAGPREQVCVTYVVDYRSDEYAAAGLQHDAPAWSTDLAETLLCLVGQLRGNVTTLSGLRVRVGCPIPRIREILNRLKMMGLIDYRSSDATDCTKWELRISDARAIRVTYLLSTDPDLKLPEAVLLAEIERQEKVSVKHTLAAIASIVHVGPSCVLRGGAINKDGLSLRECKDLCTGLGQQLSGMGRLWVLIDFLARKGISDSDGYTINPDVRSRFRQVLSITGSRNGCLRRCCQRV